MERNRSAKRPQYFSNVAFPLYTKCFNAVSKVRRIRFAAFVTNYTIFKRGHDLQCFCNK
ncbi:hypothetical protein PUN28_013674 [Cardiocondyla obscurior]|uniref:Uncharacterized protein n=1 Tax=Cardiocondyla obscurior TaxID=286306 RepID=A0AAW2F503_9HYME